MCLHSIFFIFESKYEQVIFSFQNKQIHFNSKNRSPRYFECKSQIICVQVYFIMFGVCFARPFDQQLWIVQYECAVAFSLDGKNQYLTWDVIWTFQHQFRSVQSHFIFSLWIFPEASANKFKWIFNFLFRYLHNSLDMCDGEMLQSNQLDIMELQENSLMKKVLNSNLFFATENSYTFSSMFTGLLPPCLIFIWLILKGSIWARAILGSPGGNKHKKNKHKNNANQS